MKKDYFLHALLHIQTHLARLVKKSGTFITKKQAFKYSHSKKICSYF